MAMMPAFLENISNSTEAPGLIWRMKCYRDHRPRKLLGESE